MKFNELLCYIGNGITYIFAVMQHNEIFQIIELVISILTSMLIIAYRVWRWWKEASKDGKITKEEIKDLADEIGEEVDKFKESSKDSKKGE